MTSDQHSHSYQERNQNPINRWINQKLDAITRKEIDTYISRYATREDGSHDDMLAERIRYEVTRRSQMGREIDVLEPGRWTIYSALLGSFAGGAAKLGSDRFLAGKPIVGETTRMALIGSAIASFFGALVMGGRILSFARFKAGLYAGAQTAITLHEQAKGDPLSVYTTPTLSETPPPLHRWADKIEQEREATPELSTPSI